MRPRAETRLTRVSLQGCPLVWTDDDFVRVSVASPLAPDAPSQLIVIKLMSGRDHQLFASLPSRP